MKNDNPQIEMLVVSEKSRKLEANYTIEAIDVDQEIDIDDATIRRYIKMLIEELNNEE